MSQTNKTPNFHNSENKEEENNFLNQLEKQPDKSSKNSNMDPNREPSQFQKIGSAVFYGSSSFLIMNVNKAVLTTHHFPSANVLALSQISSTVIILFILKLFRVVSYPDAKVDVLKKIFPLPMFYKQLKSKFLKLKILIFKLFIKN